MKCPTDRAPSYDARDHGPSAARRSFSAPTARGRVRTPCRLVALCVAWLSRCSAARTWARRSKTRAARDFSCGEAQTRSSTPRPGVYRIAGCGLEASYHCTEDRALNARCQRLYLSKVERAGPSKPQPAVEPGQEPVTRSIAGRMRFCSDCGQATERRVPAGEDRERHVCDACGIDPLPEPQAGRRLHRRARGAHPAVQARDRAAARLLDRAGRLPRARRERDGGRDPRDARRGAARACASSRRTRTSTCRTSVRRTCSTARSCSTSASRPASRASRSSWSRRAMIPWNELAFPVVRCALELLVEDLQLGRYRSHHAALRPRSRQLRPARAPGVGRDSPAQRSPRAQSFCAIACAIVLPRA